MSLTPEQSSALEQLWAVTASDTSAGRDRDERLLRENGWDVQVSRPESLGTHFLTAILPQRTVEQIFSMPSTNGTGGSSRAPTTIQPMEVDDSHTSVRPPVGQRRLSGARGRHPSLPARPGGAGLGTWGLFAWPITTVFSIISGAWYFISTSPYI